MRVSIDLLFGTDRVLVETRIRFKEAVPVVSGHHVLVERGPWCTPITYSFIDQVTLPSSPKQSNRSHSQRTPGRDQSRWVDWLMSSVPSAGGKLLWAIFLWSLGVDYNLHIRRRGKKNNPRVPGVKISGKIPTSSMAKTSTLNLRARNATFWNQIS